MYVVLTFADCISKTLEAMSGSVMRFMCPFLTAGQRSNIILSGSPLQGNHVSNYGHLHFSRSKHTAPKPNACNSCTRDALPSLWHHHVASACSHLLLAKSRVALSPGCTGCSGSPTGMCCGTYFLTTPTLCWCTGATLLEKGAAICDRDPSLGSDQHSIDSLKRAEMPIQLPNCPQSLCLPAWRRCGGL